jgi:hypothetical protein
MGPARAGDVDDALDARHTARRLIAQNPRWLVATMQDLREPPRFRSPALVRVCSGDG